MNTTHIGNAMQLREWVKPQSIQTVVTSPPYYLLRDYGVKSQFGQEEFIDDYVQNLVDLFDVISPTLKPGATIWLNLGDTYLSKQALLMPARVALAMQGAGWLLRQEIIWAKPNPKPENVKDRFTQAHEHIFLFANSQKYTFNQIVEPAVYAGCRRGGSKKRYQGKTGMDSKVYDTRNARSVWTFLPQTVNGLHYAPMPLTIAERCILAGSNPGDTVLDPFGGSGTTAVAAARHGRDSILIELDPRMLPVIEERIYRETVTTKEGSNDVQ